MVNEAISGSFDSAPMILAGDKFLAGAPLRMTGDEWLAVTAGLSWDLSDPSTADDQIAVVEHDSLSRGDGALWLVEGDQHLVIGCVLDRRRRWFVAMANLCLNAHRLAQLID